MRSKFRRQQRRSISQRTTSSVVLAITFWTTLTIVPTEAVELFKLTPSGAAADSSFGVSVALSGNKALVGAPTEDGAGSDFGAAYLFDVATGQQLHKLFSSDAEPDERFGESVAIDGNSVLIANRALYGVRHMGFVFDATTGQEIRRLMPINNHYEFGRSAAIAGNWALIGSSYNYYGAAHQFNLSSGNEIRVLTKSDPAVNDKMGDSVAISGDLALVGDNTDSNFSGAAYVYNLATGQQLHKLIPNDFKSGIRFGKRVALEDNLALIGTQSGSAAYLFDVTTGQQLFRFAPADGYTDPGAVALSGNLALFGPNVFDVQTGQQLAKLAPTDSAIGFGASVALNGHTALVGAQGAVYVFDVTTVPEPSTLVLAAVALVPFGLRRRPANRRISC